VQAQVVIDQSQAPNLQHTLRRWLPQCPPTLPPPEGPINASISPGWHAPVMLKRTCKRGPNKDV
jgi:hypothetical protein